MGRLISKARQKEAASCSLTSEQVCRRENVRLVPPRPYGWSRPITKALLRKVTAPAVWSDPIYLGQPRQGYGRGLILTDDRINPPNNFDSERFSLAGHE
jgi:hypothetical protein